jgi:diguanylate cyclase (GGDEF)-like protein
MLDLDRFKQLNDRWGHETGNRVLVQVAGILRDGVRRVDAVCRYGGEELVMLLPGTALPRAVRVAERLRRQIQDNPLRLGGEELQVTASFGVAVLPAADIRTGAELLAHTDALLYQAKAEGRNRVCHAAFAPVAPGAQVTSAEKTALWK